MNILVLYNESAQDATIDEADVLVQRDAVAQSLQRLGHEVAFLSCTLDLAALHSRLRRTRPDVVFNLVEALAGTDRTAPIATLLLESLEIPFTGSGTAALLAANDKLAAKRRLLEASLPTPPWFLDGWQGEPSRRAIIKAVWEHASFGMDDNAVIAVTPQTDLAGEIRARDTATGKQHFAEQFIEGREFNLTVLGGGAGLHVLPPAEIDFGAYPEGKPQIVGYGAKWDATSFEFHHTPRRFDFPPEDQRLLDQLATLARGSWEVFGLRGYARVDFRVDRSGQPWILEVNANPCLAPDAGFSAAVERSGIGYDRAIQWIVDDALRK